MDKLGWPILGTAIALGAVLTGCSDSAPLASSATTSSGRAPEVLVPRQAKVERRDITDFEPLKAELYLPPEAQASIVATKTDTVQSVLAAVGKRVRRGQELVQLTGVSTQADIDSGKAAVTAARLAYEAAATKYGEPVAEAQQRLDDLKSSSSKVASGDSATDQGSSDDLQAAQQALNQAIADKRSNMVQYREQLDQALNAVKEMQSTTRENEIVAPISGTLVQLDTNAVSTSGGPKTIGKIENLDALEIKASLTDREASRFGSGTPVTVTFTDLPNRVFEGWVGKVQAAPDKSGVTNNIATIRFRDPGHVVTAGSILKSAAVKVGVATGAVSVPAGFVRKDPSGRDVVAVSANGRVEQRHVVVGVTDGQYVQIKSGLEPGEIVVSQ